MSEVAALMNPFLRNVTDIQKREAQRVGDVQEQQLAAQASQAGAVAALPDCLASVVASSKRG